MSEIDTTLSKLTDECLGRAAEALGFMIRKKVTVENQEVRDLKDDTDAEELFDEGGYLLTTEIIGDMKGKSYLRIPEQVAGKIFTYCTGMEDENTIDKEAVFKEIDNIISASVISVLADRLKTSIYGDVPYSFKYSDSEVRKILKHDYGLINSGMDMILMNSVLKIENEPITVDFVWFVSGNIYSKLE